MASSSSNTAGKILHNSYWYGLEQVVEAVVLLGTSVLVARYLGPEKLGYYLYINFFVSIVTSTSGTGLASATRKYMSEFLALDQPGTARAVYNLAYRYQLLGALLITAVSLAGIRLFGVPAFRLMSSILILSILPGVMSWVPAQANQAFENVEQNTLSAFGFILSYAAVILLTVRLHWDLVGVASALLVGRGVEAVLRTIPLHRRLRAIPLGTVEHELKLRIRRFCLQAAGIQLLMSVVWDRSELVFLRHYSSLQQLAFYSLSFGLADKMLVLPRTFGNATGITLMVEASRDPKRVRSIVNNASRYLLFVVVPVHLGMAAVASQAVRVVYGTRYIDAIPTLMVASVLAMSRAFQEIPQVLLRAADRQKQMLIWFSITGVVNIALDWVLIPRFGAVGAAWGNGLAQTFGVFVIWQQARRFYDFSLPIGSTVRLLLAGTGMAAIVTLVVRALPRGLGLAVGIASGGLSYLVLVKLFSGLESSDRERLAPIGNRFPGPLRRVYHAIIEFATPAAG